MDPIDAIFYINLESRPDRKEHFLQEIQKLTADTSKVHRIDAIHHTNGVIGCTMSHSKALQEFIAHPEWKSCIIFEDDFTFYQSDPSQNQAALQTLFTEFPAFDCCHLTISYNLRGADTTCSSIKKVLAIQSASGYCVSKAFAPILLENLKESKDLLVQHGHPELYAHDQYWKRLQPQSNWYFFTPPLGYQYANFSDINKAFADYGC
jgi:GR25 family glycosyltransferase involved in LPS biosynthesis